ncbi:unnamed protein product [Euphydryas editha]|uniref:RRM domain-containing protein n=1 Tax=Euphydryas editha TaxID=104508 RepID=A0AAU9V8I6_EUPED|nr:unnamed protein product [Euphydryas editha]
MNKLARRSLEKWTAAANYSASTNAQAAPFTAMPKRYAFQKATESPKDGRSYASVAAAKPQQPSRPAALHLVVVTSRDEEEMEDQVLGRMTKTFDAKEGWMKVERVWKARDRKVIMGFETAEEGIKATDKLVKGGTGLVVEEVKNRDPILFLRGALSVNTDEDKVKALRNQNRDLFGGLSSGDDRITVKYRKRARNPHVAHVVIGTSPILWSRITALGSVYIDLQRVKAEY